MQIVIKDKDTIVDELAVNDIGILGELKVWQKLKELGYDGKLYTFEDTRHTGGDIELSCGIVIEVKSARRTAIWDMRGGKDFDFRMSGVYAFNVKATSADFVIVYIQAGDREAFYVCPVAMLNKGVNKIYPDATRWRFFKDNWDLLRIKETG